MSNAKLTQIFKKGLSALLVVALLVVYIPTNVSAAALTARKVTLGSSAAAATTTYKVDFTVPTTGTVVKSIAVQACDTATSCTQSGSASGFSSAGTGSGTLAAQPTGLGATSGWTTNTTVTSTLRATNTANATTPSGGGSSLTFQGVVNPTATNSTYFMKITTYSDDAWTTAIDTGVAAVSTAGQITVTATVNETLTMTLASATVALGTLSTSATGTGTSAIQVATNAASGYSLTYSGNTLQAAAGAIDIDALATTTASATGSEQFGLNVVSNTAPSVGSNISGTGTATGSTGYTTANSFKFLTGDPIASASGPTNSNTITVSYIANISGATPAGAYSTLLTYVATANF